MPTAAEAAIKDGATLATWHRDSARRQRAERLVRAYYARGEDNLASVLAKIFERPEDKIPVQLAVIKRFATEKALVFRDHPTFKVVGPDAEGEREKETELWNYLYRRGSWHRKLSTANALEQVVQTLHLHPRPMMRRGYLDLAIVSPAASIVWQDAESPQTAEAIAYRLSGRPDTPSDDATAPSRWAFWSADRNMVMELSEFTGEIRNVSAAPGNPDGLNPYGRLPFVKIDALEPCDDEYWNHGIEDMRSVEDAANVAIVSLMHALVHNGFTQKVAVNMEGADLSKHGPDVIYHAKGVTDGEVAPSMSTLTMSCDFDGMIAAVEAVLQYGTLMHGLPPSAFDRHASPQSGVAKLIDMLPLLEARKQALPVWRATMSELFAVVRSVWGHWHDDKNFVDEGGVSRGTFSADSELVTDFAEVAVIETPKEMRDRHAQDLELGVVSLVDVVMSLNPDLTRAGAIDELARIAEDKTITQPAPTPLQVLGLEPGEE